jgi:hypothetical protein
MGRNTSQKSARIASLDFPVASHKAQTFISQRKLPLGIGENCHLAAC